MLLLSLIIFFFFICFFTETSVLSTFCLFCCLLILYFFTAKTPESRKRFFKNYAAENCFDPLNPSNWYDQPTDKIMAVKVSLLSLYFFSSTSFVCTFPFFFFP